MRTRYQKALEAFRSDRFKFAVSLMVVLQEHDNEEYRKLHDGNESFNMGDVVASYEPDADGISPEKRRLFDSLNARLYHTDQLTGENRRPIPTEPGEMELNEMALYALDDATCDALMIVMYAGRDGDDALPHLYDRYDQDYIEGEFAEWWDYLHMDEEHYVRKMMAEKWPLDRYLRAGMLMFRIDER